MGQKRKAVTSRAKKVKKSKISTRRPASIKSQSVETEDGRNIEKEEGKQVWPGWATVESEPVVFTQIIKDLGIANVKAQELYDIEEDALRGIKDAHGIIFLFRWKEEQINEEIETTCPEGIWFANQVIDNACASLAMLNILFNSSAELGTKMGAFKEFTSPLTPPLKGLAVANFPFVRDIHNSFARESEFRGVDLALVELAKTRPYMTAKPESSKSKKKQKSEDEEIEEMFHFIAYIHVDNTLWELDGLKKQPVRLRSCPKDDWTIHVGPTVKERISRYPEEEFLFNLLAIVPDAGEIDEHQAALGERLKVDYEKVIDKLVGIFAGKKSTRRKKF